MSAAIDKRGSTSISAQRKGELSYLIAYAISGSSQAGPATRVSATWPGEQTRTVAGLPRMRRTSSRTPADGSPTSSPRYLMAFSEPWKGSRAKARVAASPASTHSMPTSVLALRNACTKV